MNNTLNNTPDWARHTHEPWDWAGNVTEAGIFNAADTLQIAEITSAHKIGDAARITRCVNACAGMEDPEQNLALIRNIAQSIQLRAEKEGVDGDMQDMAANILSLLPEEVSKPGGEAPDSKVVIILQGGAVQSVRTTAPMEVEIRDYDVELEDAEGDPRCRQDDEGDWYQHIAFPPDYVQQKPYVIPAETHDDHRAFEIQVDALSGFEQASDDQIRALAACGWGGNYPADAVAEYFDGRLPDVTVMFKYMKEGFECYVADEKAMEWLHVNRPQLAKELEEKE